MGFTLVYAKLEGMSKAYVPGPEADEIIASQVAQGHFATADEAVRAGVQLLVDNEAELANLRELIDEGDRDIAAGRVHRYANAGDLTADIFCPRRSPIEEKTLMLSDRARSDLDSIHDYLRMPAMRQPQGSS